MADWPNLPEDILISIVKRAVTGLEEFVVFGFVCKGWKSVMTEETFGRLKKEIPWIMPSTYKKTTWSTNIGTIYNPTKEKIYRFNLPEANTKSCYSSQGWLMTISHSDLEVELLNPLRPDQVKKLGSLKKFDNCSIKKFILSSSPSSSSDYRVMVLCDDELFAFHRGRWTLVQRPNNDSEAVVTEFHDITYYEDQFYVVASYGCIVNVYVVIEDSEEPGSRKRKWYKEPKMRDVLKYGPNKYTDVVDKCYLVESGGDLLVVLVPHFTIFKVCLPSNGTRRTGRGSVVKELGSRTLFLGNNSSSFSVDASDYYACKPNCIYFTSELIDGELIRGIFHMGDGKTEQCQKVDDFARSDLWIQPRPYNKSVNPQIKMKLRSRSSCNSRVKFIY